MGNLFIADSNNYRIRKVTPDGIISTVAGIGGGSAPQGDEGPAMSAQLSQPKDIGVDSGGRIYFLDGRYGGRIRVIDSNGVIHSFAGAYSSGTITSGPPPLLPMVTGDFQGIAHMAIGSSAKTIYFTGGFNFGATLWKANLEGGNASRLIAGSEGLGNLTVDSEGSLFYVSYSSIRKLFSSGIDRLIAGGESSSPADGVPAIFVPLDRKSVV